jgi:pre-rRNA-processing protein IPI1
MIIPLLFETWLEVKPPQENLSESASSISSESGYMLHIIMDTLLQLWEMLKTDETNKSWFLSNYAENFASYFLENFPYFQNTSKSNKNEIVGGEKCLYQNLNISYLFLIFYTKNRGKFGKYRARIFQFVNDCIFQWKPKDNDFNQLLSKFISTAFLEENKSLFENESKKLFANLIEKYDFERASKENDVKLGILCEMIEKSDVVDKRLVL